MGKGRLQLRRALAGVYIFVIFALLGPATAVAAPGIDEGTTVPPPDEIVPTEDALLAQALNDFLGSGALNTAFNAGDVGKTPLGPHAYVQWPSWIWLDGGLGAGVVESYVSSPWIEGAGFLVTARPVGITITPTYDGDVDLDPIVCLDDDLIAWTGSEDPTADTCQFTPTRAGSYELELEAEWAIDIVGDPTTGWIAGAIDQGLVGLGPAAGFENWSVGMVPTGFSGSLKTYRQEPPRTISCDDHPAEPPTTGGPPPPPPQPIIINIDAVEIQSVVTFRPF